MKDLTQGKESKVILAFAAPMLVGNLFQQTYTIFDSIIVGRLIGDEALAAVGASFPIIFALISFVIGIATAGTIIISQYYGAKDFKKVQKAIDTIFVFIFFASLLIMVIGIGFGKKIFELTKLPEEVIPQATVYLRTIIMGTVLLFGFNGINSILRGVGDSKTPLYFQIAAALLNIILDYVFIKYFHMGIRGAALAYVIAHAVTFVSAAVYLNKTHKLVRINFIRFDFSKEIFRHSLRIGLPSGLQQTFVALGMIALYRIVNDFGTDVVAAYSVAGRIDGLAMIPSMIFGQALSSFVGQNLGAGKTDRVRRGLIATLVYSIAVSFSVALIVIVFRKFFMGVFTETTEVIEIGAEYLIIVSSCYIIFSIMFALNGVMRGAGDTLIPMFITLFSLWVIRVPFAAILSKSMDEIGIWIAVPLAWSVGSLFSFIYYRTGNWKKRVIIHPSEP
ncbi:MAG TPA: MATE family efflux transporter [Bacteroidales bacterium]|jgi:putative MATE family efflux protein|nr:MATE family efflux transporter [Bacteroidales bacterium]